MLTVEERDCVVALKRAANEYTKSKKEIDWEQRRYETASKYAIQLLAQQWFTSDVKAAVELGIELADELMRQLKGGRND